MAYDEQTWVDDDPATGVGGSPLTAERFNHMEGGITAAHELVADAAAAVEAAQATADEANTRAMTPGPQGDPGPIGPPGIDGADGAQGPSAYDVWLAAGNSGDVNAYLASLQGAQGIQGVQGPQGIQGPAGPVLDRLAAAALYVDDWNNATQNGWYRSNPSTAHSPAAATYYVGEALVYAESGEIIQWAADIATGTRFRRMRSGGGAWSAWVQEIGAPIIVESMCSVNSPAFPPNINVDRNFDGFVPVSGGLYLNIGATNPAENGLWIWNSGLSAMTRPAAYPSLAYVNGMMVVPKQGKRYGDTMFRYTGVTNPTVQAAGGSGGSPLTFAYVGRPSTIQSGLTFTSPASLVDYGPYLTADLVNPITSMSDQFITYDHNLNLTATQIANAIVFGHVVDQFFGALMSWRINGMSANQVGFALGNASTRGDVKGKLRFYIRTTL